MEYFATYVRILNVEQSFDIVLHYIPDHVREQHSLPTAYSLAHVYQLHTPHVLVLD